MRETRAELHAVPATRPTRLSLSDILALMLTRGSGERSSVSLTRNARGETQIEVTVRTGDAETIADAERDAREVYDRLRADYPLSGTGRAPLNGGE